MVQAKLDRQGDQLKSALAVAALHGLFGYALLTGLTINVTGRPGETLKVFDIRAERPPALVKSQRRPMRNEPAKGAASAPNKKTQPAPVMAPPREIKLDLIAPVVAAPTPRAGRDVSAGATPQWGPGTGSAGVGIGLGSGAGGAGAGGGGLATRARQIAGRIVDSDYPRAAKKARAEGAVLARFSVGKDGRASGCTLLESSGHPELDATTCRLIERRFRFEPARDAHGDLTVDIKAWQQIWWLEPAGPRAVEAQDRD
jgi:periplasmic protein TonB